MKGMWRELLGRPLRLFVVLVALLALVGCAGGAQQPVAGTEQQVEQEAAEEMPAGEEEAPAAAEEPMAEERVLIIAIPSDIQNLDPTLSSGDVLTQEVLTNVYSFLIDFELKENDEGNLIGDANSFVGDVAESFEWNEDRTKITFHLRDGIKFSNGDPIDAEAVKFTYDRIFGQGGVTAFLTGMAAVEGADSINVVDDTTVEFEIATPNTLLLGNMAQFGHSILNPNVVEPYMTEEDPYAHEWLSANTEGTESGPYVIDSWDPGNEIVLTPNPNYWGEVQNDRIILKVIPDPSTRLAQIKAGAVDVAYNIPTKDLDALADDPNVTVNRRTTRAVAYIGMNSQVPPFDNQLVRQAISYAIPYDTILNQVLHGYGIQLTSPIPEGTPFHTDEFFKYEQDFDKAKALLEEAGFPDGFETTFTIRNDSAEAQELAVWVQSALSEIGIDVEIEQMPGAAFTEEMQRRDHTFFYANQWISINNDPFYHVFWLLRADCCDYARYQNDRVWELIDEYTLSTDAEAREQAAMEIQQTAVEDAPWVFLFQPDQVIVTRSDVKGYVWYSADRYLRYGPLYKEGWQ